MYTSEKTSEKQGSSESSDDSISETGALDTEGADNVIEARMKRAAAKRLIERYFYQLTDGCGNPHCKNNFCVSSGQLQPLTPDEAAAKAIQLFSQDVGLCDPHRKKVARTQAVPPKSSSIGNANIGDVEKTCFDADETESFLTEQSLYDLIDICEDSDCYAPLIRKLGEVYSCIENLSRSFLCTDIDEIESDLDFDKDRIKGLKKEDIRRLQGEKDKDVDSSTDCTHNQVSSHVDLASVRRAYKALFKLKTNIFETPLVTALVTLAGNLQMQLPIRKEQHNNDDIINVLLIVFEIPVLGSGDFLETALPGICRASQWLSVGTQAKLARVWASPQGRTGLRNILEALQQLITLRVIVTQFHRNYYVQDENVITSATRVMKILYYANMLAGCLGSPDLRTCNMIDSTAESESSSEYTIVKPPPYDQLALTLGVHILDCRQPYLPYAEFYNEPLSDLVEMDRDFAIYKSESGKFAFMNYPFILTPATKMMGLYFDNRIRMYSERRISIIQTVTGQPSNPYLKLKVRRDNIIEDALVELEIISKEKPKDLRKQLVVEFEGEQGIDEGGVSKEFFHLIIDEIFNLDYAMFIKQGDSNTVWFNPTSFESDAQFSLVGIVLGLAIYNNVILALNFPMVLYRKLMGRRGSFEDLQDWNPVLYNSLKQLLDYNESNVEDVFMQTFRISYQDVFGSIITHDLKEHGDEINVTQDNKYEFVDLYADLLLNKCVEKQFSAFYKGFHMVMKESPLELLFRPDEVEGLICGSKNFDFDELEDSTQYDAGYSSDSPVIKNFWEVVHALSLDEKRKLLQFTTGSDRVPIGGLSNLKLVIARNGSDSDRLPTAHTCFNVLLLPEYSTKEKLNDRLIKAISYSKGFGML